MLRNCIRVIALILIAIPEPISTAIGIAMLAATLKMSKHLRKFANMEELVKRSLKRIESDSSSPWTLPKKTAVYHELNRLSKDTPAISHTYSQTGNWFDNRRIPAKTWHHTLQHSIVQYEVKPAVFKTSNPGANGLEIDQSLELHTLKTNDLSQRTASQKTPASDAWKKHFFTPDEVVFHALKTTE